jgi:hypothetical protein
LTKGIIKMKAILARQPKYLYLMGLLIFSVTDAILAGDFATYRLQSISDKLNWDNVDTDSDGIFDRDDNCIYASNPQQLNTDNDAMGNVCDTDDDNDGLLDYKDAFPLDPNRSKFITKCDRSFTGYVDGHYFDYYDSSSRCAQSNKKPSASKNTLLGIDSDRDGIRDDVQKKIEEKFGKNTTVTNYTKGMAESFQKILLGAPSNGGTLSHKQVNQQVAKIKHLDACIQNKTNANGAGLQFLLPEQLNTVARTRAYLKAAAEAYDAEGPPVVEDCGSSTKSLSSMKAFVIGNIGGGILKGRSNTRTKLNPPNLDGYEIIFINGVRNDEEKAGKGKKRLNEILGTNTVKLEWNENHMLGQFFDLWVHKVGEIQVDKTGTWRFWLSLYFGLIKADNSIYQALADWLDPNREAGHWAEKDLKRMTKRAKTALKNHKKVIIVAHSEGNFFYRNIHKALNKWDSTKTQQCSAGIGFAPLLSSKPGNYDYITSKNDRHINAARMVWPNILKANIDIPPGHGLLDSYLLHDRSLQRFKIDMKEAVNKLDKSCVTKKCANPLGKSGGHGAHQYTYALKDTSAHRVEISFEAYNIPDRIKITANGETIAQTNGLVGGYHQWQIDYDPKKHGKEFIAHVDAPNGGTAWKLCIDCEGSSCGGNIKRKKVHYSFIDSKFWDCDNYKIDGQTVNRFGEMYLSVGKHSFSASCTCNRESDAFCEKPFFGFPVISVSGTACSFNPRKNSSCSMVNGSRLLEVK